MVQNPLIIWPIPGLFDIFFINISVIEFCLNFEFIVHLGWKLGTNILGDCLFQSAFTRSLVTVRTQSIKVIFIGVVCQHLTIRHQAFYVPLYLKWRAETGGLSNNGTESQKQSLTTTEEIWSKCNYRGRRTRREEGKEQRRHIIVSSEMSVWGNV